MRGLSTRPAFIGLCTAFIGVAYLARTEHQLGSAFHNDFDMQLMAARMLLSGQNPYALIGPHRAFDYPWHLYYPAPTLVLFAALAWFPVWLARSIFVAATCFALSFALAATRQPWWRYLVFVSACAQSAVLLGQTSLLFAAMWLLPVFGLVAAIKPNVAAAIAAARLRWRWLIPPIIGGSLLVGLSFAIAPHWLGWWLGELTVDPTRSMAVARPWGMLLLLAGLKWRRAEARLLLCLSVVPQTLGPYDGVLLFFIPSSAAQSIALVALSHFVFVVSFGLKPASLTDAVIQNGISVVHLLYLPALAMVLVRRNEGAAPAWLERRLARFPDWLRGDAGTSVEPFDPDFAGPLAE